MHLSFSPHLPVLKSNIKATLNEATNCETPHCVIISIPLSGHFRSRYSLERYVFLKVVTQTAWQAVSSFIYSTYVVRFCEGRSELMFTLRVRSEIKNP